MMLKYRYFLNNKFIILIITLIAFVSYNCSTFILSSKNIEIREHLSCSKKLLKQKKYEQAIKKNKMILNKYTKNPWKDRILFNLGYLYSYYDNPEKNFPKSKTYFQRLVDKFPNSSLQKESKIRLAFLNELLSKENEIKKLEKTIYIQKTAIDLLKAQLKKIKRVDIQLDKKERKMKKESSKTHNSINKK